MTHQSVNLRAGSGAISFGSDADRLAWEAECEVARRLQRVRFAVSPRQSLKLFDGIVLNSGDEVELDKHFRVQSFPAGMDAGSPVAARTIPTWRQLSKLVSDGVVLEAYNLPSAGVAGQ